VEVSLESAEYFDSAPRVDLETEKWKHGPSLPGMVVARVVIYACQNGLESLRVDGTKRVAYLRDGNDCVRGDLSKIEGVKK
jgi:hypothetical protein